MRRSPQLAANAARGRSNDPGQMIRVVLDTNVIVSAYLNQDGLPFYITKLALSGIIQLCSSEPILAEYE